MMEIDNNEPNEMLKVDPVLFIKCRLCLNNTGLYQIVPKIKSQIKFCFDIEVELFDGLPPLICKQCELILSKYVATKQNFQDIQNTLKTKLKSDAVNSAPEETVVQPAQETVSSTQQIESGSSTSNNEHQEEDNNTLKSISTTTVEENTNASPVSFIDDEDKSTLKIRIKNWKAKYVKHYACRFCTKTYKDKRSINNHIKNKHSNVLSRYATVFKKYCLVRLDKIDNKANITGSKKMVLTQNRIIQNKKAHYYITYLTKPSSNSDISLSDEEELTFSRKKRKTLRLSSTSSTDTLLIERSNTCGLNDIDQRNVSKKEESCTATVDVTSTVYSVEDSDSTLSCHSHKESELNSDDQQKKINNNDIITNIVKMCHSRFLDKIKNADDTKNNTMNKMQKESQMIHKVLSIGSKVINNKGFQCTGLLRYLEHKNLEVSCDPKTSASGSYIRIKTKLREKHVTDNKFSRWQNLEGLLNKDTSLDFSDSLQHVLVSTANTEHTSLDSSDASQHISVLTGNTEQKISEQNLEIPITETEKTAHSYKEDHAVIVKNKCTELEKHLMSQKLLNANPVANPKQLPKKTINTETKSCYFSSNTATSIENLSIGNHMPIITSIKSLAGTITNRLEENSNITQISTTENISEPAPKLMSRIKVKPVSELMPKKPEISSSNIISQPSASSWNTHHLVVAQGGSIFMSDALQFNVNNLITTNVTHSTKNASNSLVSIPTLLFSEINEIPLQEPSSSMANNHKYVILNTVQLPNKKTDSPFSYFKQLLKIHDIILLEANDPISPQSITLIKFKLLFQQKSSTPVSLCLELISDIRTFCIKIRDCNLKEIDINKLTANWQLEILDSFSKDVTTVKVLSRAEKENPQMFEKTNYFISLLKSIQKSE